MHQHQAWDTGELLEQIFSYTHSQKKKQQSLQLFELRLQQTQIKSVFGCLQPKSENRRNLRIHSFYQCVSKRHFNHKRKRGQVNIGDSCLTTIYLLKSELGLRQAAERELKKNLEGRAMRPKCIDMSLFSQSLNCQNACNLKKVGRLTNGNQ